MSTCRKHIILVNAPPINENTKIKMENVQNLKQNTCIIRSIPYPPSLSSTPARTIEPATGASTCALGSHKCSEKIGVFTRNANSKKTH